MRGMRLIGLTQTLKEAEISPSFWSISTMNGTVRSKRAGIQKVKMVLPMSIVELFAMLWLPYKHIQIRVDKVSNCEY